MSGDEPIRDLFGRGIFPDFPFINKRWLGVAFDRDRWVSRIPQWYFEEMQDLLSSRDAMCIYGSSVSGGGQASSYAYLGSLDFSWKEFSSFIASDANYSPEYWMFDVGRRWACRMDHDLTVWGAELPIMDTFYSRRGEKLAFCK
jgi:hypothetical protein